MEAKNLKLETGCGDRFGTVAKKAQELAVMSCGNAVEFDFNGVLCVVDSETNLDWLFRDYCNAHTMNWETVGAKCVEQYDPAVQKELDKRTAEENAREEERRKKYKLKEEKERAEYEKSVAGVEMEFGNEQMWKDGLDKNVDPYGRCCYDYAEAWAKLMQVQISKGKTVAQCAEKTSHQLSFFGITGFMYGCAVGILSSCWKHGEELRKWHNKEYGHEGDGVVNPAILTIGKD